MIAALRSLRKQARAKEDRAIGKLILSPKLRDKFGDELKSQFGWDGSLQELFRLFLEHLPEILALIMKIVA